MTTITVDLPPDIYRKLQEQAQRSGKPPELVVREWLAERLAAPQALSSDRERAREALRAAGLRDSGRVRTRGRQAAERNYP